MNTRLALLAAALAVSALAGAEAPGRIAQLTYAEGQVSFQAAQARATTALPDRPLEPGDRLATAQDARVEIALDTATVRLDERTELAVTSLDPDTVRLGLDAGTANVTLRDLYDNETFEIATPNSVITLDRPGDYRVDVVSDDTSFLSVHGGAAQVATAGGPVRVVDNQRVRIAGRDAVANLETPRPTDPFDDWVLEREVHLAQSEPPYDGTEYAELDQYGEWRDDPSYGQVWMPSYAYGGYDPFRYGYWEQAGYSSIWIGTMPWSGYTNHAGRWMYLHGPNRWCWVPTRRGHRPGQVAQDTAPFGHPHGDHRDDDDRGPAANPSGPPRRIDADRPPVYLGSGATGKPAHGGTFVPRVNPTPVTPRPPVVPPPRPQPSTSPTPAPTPTPSRTAPVGSSTSVKAAKRTATWGTATPPQPSRESGTVAPP